MKHHQLSIVEGENQIIQFLIFESFNRTIFQSSIVLLRYEIETSATRAGEWNE